MSRQLNPDQNNPFIEIGRILSENSFERAKKEVRIENMVIDLLKTSDENIIIGEIKKSSKFLKSAQMQLAYYLWRLKKLGIIAVGQLLFPKEKKKILVTLTQDLEKELMDVERNIKSIISKELPPPPIKIKFCSKCGYNELCWA